MTIEGSSAGRAAPRIRLGQVGGGSDAFIGAVHRIASRIDDRYELVAGAFSSTAERSQASGAALGVEPARTYDDYEAMAKRERRLKDGIEAVSIVTPNHLHVPVAKAFARAGIHVICDKPLASSLRDAKSLRSVVEKAGIVFAVTYNYTGYPMVRQAREMVRNGEIGAVRVVRVEYPQDWLAEDLETTGQKQADWRVDPARAGVGGSLGDIGTHAYHLAGFVTGLEVSELLCEATSFVAGRRLDDNAQVLLRFDGGARGALWCSQVAPGHENGLRLRVYGERGGLEWSQENPNALWHTPLGEPKRLVTRNGAGAGAAAGRVSRVPAGHPEGYLEGFANVYREVADAIQARRDGREPDGAVMFPGLEDGIHGVAFVEAAVRSSEKGGRWVSL